MSESQKIVVDIGPAWEALQNNPELASMMTEMILGPYGKARLLSEWHEELGDVLWWKFPLEEAPYVGTPLDLGQTVEIAVTGHKVDKLMRVNVGGWPGYHTHWTPLLAPAEPITQ